MRGNRSIESQQAAQAVIGRLRERSEPGPSGPTKAQAVGVGPHGIDSFDAYGGVVLVTKKEGVQLAEIVVQGPGVRVLGGNTE